MFLLLFCTHPVFACVWVSFLMSILGGKGSTLVVMTTCPLPEKKLVLSSRSCGNDSKDACLLYLKVLRVFLSAANEKVQV